MEMLYNLQLSNYELYHLSDLYVLKLFPRDWLIPSHRIIRTFKKSCCCLRRLYLRATLRGSTARRVFVQPEIDFEEPIAPVCPIVGVLMASASSSCRQSTGHVIPLGGYQRTVKWVISALVACIMCPYFVTEEQPESVELRISEGVY